MAVDNQDIEHSTVQSFENYHLGDKGDTVIAKSEAIATVAVNAALDFNTNGGDDRVVLGDVALHHYVSARTGSGDDIVEVGAISSASGFGKINLIGGEGDDTLRLDAPEGAGLYLRLGSSGSITENEGSLEYETKQGATIVAVGELSGFEHFDGSGNKANTFDASNHTMHSGKLELTGGTGKDTFYLADMTGGSVTVTGSQDGQDDKLVFGGTQHVNLQLNARGDINAVSMAGQKVSITATGLSAFEGGGGNDTLNAQAVTSVDSADKTMTLWGDGGNDILYAGKIADGTFVLKASHGNDTLYGGAYGDRIELGGLHHNDGNDSINISGDYSGGSDTIVVTEQASGSVTYITGFNKSSDVLDDKEFMTAGWIRSAHTTDGRSGVTVTYTKKEDPTYSFDLQFTDIKTNPDIFLPGAVSVSDNENYTIPEATPGVIEVFGSSGNNTILGGSQDGASIYGGGGNDNITGGNANDSIVIAGGDYTVTAAGAKGNDTIVVNGDITGGVYSLYGETGSESSEYDADTFYIGAIADTSRVSIYGGSPIGDDSTPDKVIFSATNGVTVAPSSNQDAPFYISGIDVLQGTAYNDSIDVSAVAVSEDEPSVTVYGGAGNDTIWGGNNQLLSGDAGDDLLILTGANTNVTLNGGDGNDTVTLNEQDKGLFLTFNSAGGISDSGVSYYETLSTNSPDNTNITTAHVNINAVEHFDGSQNAANYFDARAYTMKSGSLGLYGGTGHDMFYLGNIQGGSVTLVGGEDTPVTNLAPGVDISTGDRFHIGNVGTAANVSIEAGVGDGVKDKLYFDGNQTVKLTLNAMGDISSVSMNRQKVKITATGLSAYEGSSASDSIDASLVTSVDSSENAMTLEGGRGNDTIRTGNINDGIFYVEADAGADSIIGGAGTDHIALGDYEGDSATDAYGNTYLISNDGGDTISTGGGRDVITVFEQKHETSTTITDFDVKLDELDDSRLLDNGWSKGTTAGQNGTMLTYSNGDKKFYLQLTNVFDFSTAGAQKTTLNAGAQYTGSLYGDTITVNLGGNAPIYLNTNGAQQDGNRDMIYLNVNSSSPDTVTHVIEAPITDGSSAHARLYVNGSSGATIKFGETIGDVVRTNEKGSPQIVYTNTDPSIGNGRVVRAEEGSSYEGGRGYYIIDQGTVATMTELTVGEKTVHLNASGFSKYYGTTGADSVDATAIKDASVKIEYESQGGNDTYRGGSGIDMVHAISMNANTKMDFDGGEGGSDWLFLEGTNMTVALDSVGNISGLKYGTTPVANSKFSNFENFYFHEYDNNADKFDASNYVEAGSDSRTLAVTMGGGSDTVILNPDGNISSEKSFDAYGGTGNDLFQVGAVTTQTNIDTGICLNGGAGADTYALRAEGHALTIDETSDAEYDNDGNMVGSPDRIEFYGVHLEPGKETEFLSGLSFSLEDDYDHTGGYGGNPLRILKISGVDSQSGSAALNFQSFDFTDDVMNFYDSNGNELLSGDVDIKSIVDAIQYNGGTQTNFTFSMGDDGRYKVS